MRLPRSRGDGPTPSAFLVDLLEAAPLTRGWTQTPVSVVQCRLGCPAHAGMDPPTLSRRRGICRLPRSRGDGPQRAPVQRGARGAAPLTRGWTRLRESRHDASTGCPAHAGMDPPHTGSGGRVPRLPRSRGDGPAWIEDRGEHSAAAPLTRGWTPVPALHLGRTHGCPAHAGMDRASSRATPRVARLPRSRGDGPTTGEANNG